MPPTDGLLKRTLLDLSKSRSPQPSATDSKYGSVNLSENSSAVIGNVVNQYFYGGQPSVHDPVDPDDDGGSRSVDLRNKISKVQVETISDYDHKYAHWLRSHRRIPGTCNWMMELVEFKDWVTGTGPPVLVCVGSVGCGKSINTSAVIDWLDKPLVGTKPPVLSYYVDTTRQHPTTTSEILHALVKQIVILYRESSMDMPQNLYDKAEAICTPLTSATTSIFKLSAVIQDFIRLQPLCFLIVDGIDSLLEPEIQMFIKFLRNVWNSQLSFGSQCKLMLSCRETLGRRIPVESIPSSTVLQIRLENIEPDIHLYVDSEVVTRQAETPITNDDMLVDKIKSVLKSNSEKMFLWIYLQILSLWDPGLTTCDQDIRDQLESLPQGLDEVYLRCLRRIDTTNDKRSSEIAPRMFRWLASAQVALTPVQACEAVSMTPHNLPIQRPQVLTSPVTDYCANLVVIDDLTGTVKFTHPSVKAFLSDSERVPPELRYLTLSHTESDFWCGRICLAHAKLHHSRKQLVAFGSQEIEPNITKPILENIFRNVLPFKTRPRHTQSRYKPFRMPIPTVSHHQASSVVDLSLHDYICHHWLEHNASIHEELPHYVDFVNLCVAHDPDLQVWSTSPATNTEHYRRMVMYAVMINHAPLLRVARDAIKARGQNYWQGVFHRYAPGTDSTYLHCAAVLGHIAVLRLLLSIYSQFNTEIYPGNLADVQGASAAFAAIQAQQTEAFGLLIADRHGSSITSVWELRDLELEKPARSTLFAGTTLIEDLFDHCAANGNLEATKLLLAKMLRIGFYSARLASAFFLACKNGHQDVGKLLIGAGADHKIFQGSGDFRLIDPRLTRHQSVSALNFVYTFGDLKMMSTLLAIRRAIGIKVSAGEVLQIMQPPAGRNPDYPLPYLRLLLEFGGRDEKSDRPGWELLSWLMCLPVSGERVVSSSQSWDHIIRLILQSSYTGPYSTTALKRRSRLPGSIEHDRLAAWFEWATDDVLVEAVGSMWIKPDFLVSPFCLNVAFSRDSSRLMESIVDCLFSTKDYSYRAPHKEEVSRLLFKWNLSDTLATGAVPGWLHRAITVPRTQILEFLVCTGLPERLQWSKFGQGSKVGRRYRATISEAVSAYNSDFAHPQYPCLMWIRCYLKMKGDVAATRELCRELRCFGSTGNFALNFPAGYDHTYVDEQRHLSVKTWVISRKIWLAVHRWNFRLNRAHRKRYSESDIWYMASVLSKKPIDRRMRSGM